jgi:hypothetical protein
MSDDTKVTYNGIGLTNVLTKEFSQEPIYDPSGTDLLYHRFRITVSGLVHPEFLSPYLGASPGNTNMANNFRAIQDRLNEPRREFEYKIGEEVILRALPSDSEERSKWDLNSGPKPSGVKITHAAGARILRIEFTIEVCRLICEDATNISGVLSNRWSSIDDYDGDWYCTRTIAGRLQVSTVNMEPHAFRNLVVPPLQPGFKRHSMNFNVDTAGLTIDYTIVDRQIPYAAPGGATSWTARHTTSSPDGIVTHGEVEIELTGPPSASKTALLVSCAQVIENKLALAAMGNNQYFILNASIVDYLHENRVGMVVRILHNQSGEGVAFNINDPLSMMGKPVSIDEYNRFRSPVPPVTGEASPIGLFVSYWQSPCNDEHSIFKTEATEQSENVPEESNAPEPQVTYGDLPKQAGPYSEEHKQAIYTVYEVSGRYEHNPYRIALPIAGGGDSDDDVFVVQLTKPGGGLTYRHVKIKAERVGEPPQLPSFANYNEAPGVAVLMDVSIIPHAPQLTADVKKLLYRIEAEYKFALTKSLSRLERLRMGSRAYDSTNADDNTIPGSAFIDGIL